MFNTFCCSQHIIFEVLVTTGGVSAFFFVFHYLISHAWTRKPVLPIKTRNGGACQKKKAVKLRTTGIDCYTLQHLDRLGIDCFPGMLLV